MRISRCVHFQFWFGSECEMVFMYFRFERHKERARDRNIQRAAPEKRSKLQRDRERDISEKIALGLPAKSQSDDASFDQRLFNQSKGMSFCLRSSSSNFTCSVIAYEYNKKVLRS